MRLPDAVALGVARALEAAGQPADVLKAVALGGGSIHRAARLDTPAGPVFLKWNRGPPARGFGAEARSLQALAGAAPPELLAVPEVLGWQDGAGEDGYGWLALEYIPPSSPGPGFGERLGIGLAAIHRTTAAEPGWPEDNLIGSLPQPNPPGTGSWTAFWTEARLRPQLERARRQGFFRDSRSRCLDRVVRSCGELLAPVSREPASLLHGDLWSGNIHPGPGGLPTLLDPASYFGHREVDLAMAQLFGGVPSGMVEAYQDAWPLMDGYAGVRRPLYQLYYLLVHVNLFGSAYVGQALRAAESASDGL